jgi:L-lactate dehydrogenase complex protein LldG
MNAILESSPMIDLFRSRAEAVGAKVEHVHSKAEALELVVRLLQQEGVEDKPQGHAVWASSAILGTEDKAKLANAVPGLEFNVTRENAAAAKVGISQMDWALADTGTLVQAADAVDKRLVSTLPLLHIALISAAAVLPNLPAVLDRVHPDKAAYLAFVTGPSRTSDIERVLTIGVHGPERLIAILVDGLEVEA